jgi:hypothetical protein
LSAAGRGTARVPGDFYPTPGWCVGALLAELHTDMAGLVWGEPCRGDGAIYDRLPEPRVWAEVQRGVDYLTAPLCADVVITNPPYSLAEQFLAKSLEEAMSVFYLLRLGFMGGQVRHQFWTENRPTHLYVLSNRPSFVAVCKGCGIKYPLSAKGTKCTACGGPVSVGTDASDYAWYGWDRLGVCKQPPGIYWLKRS